MQISITRRRRTATPLSRKNRSGGFFQARPNGDIVWELLKRYPRRTREKDGGKLITN
jgi:hypothetical protein